MNPFFFGGTFRSLSWLFVKAGERSLRFCAWWNRCLISDAWVQACERKRRQDQFIVSESVDAADGLVVFIVQFTSLFPVHFNIFPPLPVVSFLHLMFLFFLSKIHLICWSETLRQTWACLFSVTAAFRGWNNSAALPQDRQCWRVSSIWAPQSIMGGPGWLQSARFKVLLTLLEKGVLSSFRNWFVFSVFANVN